VKERKVAENTGERPGAPSNEPPRDDEEMTWATFAEQMRAVLHQALTDVEALRRYALNPAGNRVTNPSVLGHAMRLEAHLVMRHERIMAELIELQLSAQAWEAVLAEIAAESPRAAKQIRQTLKDLLMKRLSGRD
jgi:hypothetical protein